MKNPRNYLIALLSLALVGVTVWLYTEHSNASDLAAQLRTAKESADRLRALHAKEQADLANQAKKTDERIHELERHDLASEALIKKLEAREQDLASELAASRRAAAQPQVVAPPSAGSAPVKPLLTVAPDPAAIAAQAARLRLQVAGRYGPLAQKLGLSPTQSDQLMRLLVDKQMIPNDATLAGLQQGGNVLNDPGAFATVVAESQDQIENQIQALLGDEGYAQYLQWNITAGQSGSIARLQAALAGTEPLSDAQVTQLQQLLNDNHVGHLTAKILATAQAQGFLSSTQMQALASLFEQQQAAQQARRAPQALPASHTK